MFCAVYEFKVKAGQTVEFERSWANFTEAIHRVCGSLGSRLHKTTDPLIYVAYAQWPSKEIFERKISKESYTVEEWAQREVMLDALENSKKVYELEVHDDHLR
ncbi:MAG: antibiotic biosynthesis monooxygenase [Proteobacteria bacterium]|jgi:heme-degrading monooxygenase HmoA|nr:antibiotic biosynthesis monooxygenase [Pseudomonadota bacterium]